MYDASFTFTPDQRAIRDAVQKICDKFGEQYWMDAEREHRFPDEFVREMADNGWLGIAMPVEYGGGGLGITEAAIMMQTVGQHGGAATSSINVNVFGLNPVVRHGTDEQKRRWLPPMIQGKDRAAFGVTEPNAGLDTSRIETRAVRDGDHYVVNGRKMFTTTAQSANKFMLITRTTPREECEKALDGLTLFYTDFDRSCIEARQIEKFVRHAVDINAVFIDNLKVPVEDRIGEEGRGFYYLLDGLNPERILIGAEHVEKGRVVLNKAAEYAKERIVFDRPIGQNQAIAHPLAESWMELEAANLMLFKAAALYDRGEPCGPEANAGKYLAAEASFKAASNAMLTLGGYSVSSEFIVERFYREAIIGRIAPVSLHMIKNYVASNVLGLPKSY
ncbi:MAG: acyl-CoA/acyl-ACP dehydrogenase [Rhodospirillaceae bacterium]|jgi:acyl-CoA dehydrogenase|nr:acyl-CoA/acyl-ACP dehydrogenase [Rhodospirillaceae bacterium]MBT3491222.1 acyl-CoA/acyl-ACP dehydrogenase [Rhodospirillaceae bacterium]MBT3781155.1 acyl-CoA/acyl-ACP dehydrogenase [Rhodospirillaceae bacterium]MBT3979525.1 acyl-CoA/acyl-ACP dehydrogenase [Rhodospirillaceae bacterium]MBT4169811.1 acyl-CoA/acyl-ACP dehydrogenase [Rhodospirillaceae bacterium]